MISKGRCLAFALVFLGAWNGVSEPAASAPQAPQEGEQPAAPDSRLRALAFGFNEAGEALSRQHQLAEARRSYEVALTFAQLSHDLALESLIRNNLGLHFFELNQYEEALPHLERALQLARQLQRRKDESSILVNLSNTLAMLGAFEAAEAHLKDALTLAQQQEDAGLEQVVRARLALIRLHLNEIEAAREQLRESWNLYSESRAHQGDVETLTVDGLVEAKVGDPVKARQRLERAITKANGAGFSELEALGHLGLALTHLRQKAYEVAVAELASAFALFDVLGNAYGRAYLQGMLAVIERQIEEAAAARALPEAVKALEAFEAIQDPIRSDDYLSSFIAAASILLYETVVELAYDQGQLAVAFSYAERARARVLLRQLGRAHGDVRSALQVDIPTVGLDVVQGELLDDETTLVAYYVLRSKILVWVVDSERAYAWHLTLSRQDLLDQVGSLHNLILSRDAEIHDLAGELHQRLVAPFVPYLRHRKLILVPHGALHDLPFASLWNAETQRFLVEAYTLTQVPSASVLPFLVKNRTPWEQRLLVLGNPDGSLRHAEEEAKAIGEMFALRPLLRGEAKESTLRALSGKFDTLHLAAHGTYDAADPLLSHVTLAPGDGEDGRLEVHEVVDLDLQCVHLVVLSACKSALGERTRGDEITGLTRAFLHAGSSAVLTSLWPIDDAASRALMTFFYAQLRRGLGPAEALRQAQVAMLARPEWRAPYFWAAFHLTGDHRSWRSPTPEQCRHRRVYKP